MRTKHAGYIYAQPYLPEVTQLFQMHDERLHTSRLPALGIKQRADGSRSFWKIVLRVNNPDLCSGSNS